jgi:hypothetical protein
MPYVRLHFARVHGKNDGIVIFPFQFGSHVSNGHVQGSLGRSICGETIFHLSKVAL